ncbi:hypothetical protein niasHT_019275 [Heterodera trifolii]|uniref:Uncharacterized protein n=1 Tax=Heterodera trifolii TaxID=157864 RepID=A0ABD2L0Q2_9BILA
MSPSENCDHPFEPPGNVQQPHQQPDSKAELRAQIEDAEEDLLLNWWREDPTIIHFLFGHHRAPAIEAALLQRAERHHSTTPNAERRKNFASGTILSEVFPTPRPLAHPETRAAKLAHPLSGRLQISQAIIPPPPKLNGGESGSAAMARWGPRRQRDGIRGREGVRADG